MSFFSDSDIEGVTKEEIEMKAKYYKKIIDHSLMLI